MPDLSLADSEIERTRLLALETVPPATIRRWNARRKAQVVEALEASLLTEEEACRYYRLTIEELAAWRRAMALAGRQGLLATKPPRQRPPVSPTTTPTHAHAQWSPSP